MELVPYPGLPDLPRKYWKKVYTDEEKQRVAPHNLAKESVRRARTNLTDDGFKAVVAVYALAAKLTRDTGIKHVVDHIYPVNGVQFGVCGLTTPSNLMILTKRENSVKSNKPHSSWVDYCGFD